MQERSHTYEVELSEDQRLVLQQLIAKGNAPVRQQAHARILLKIDRHAPGPRWTDEQVAEAFEMSRYTVIRIRERFVNNGLDDALNHRVYIWSLGSREKSATSCPKKRQAKSDILRSNTN